MKKRDNPVEKEFNKDAIELQEKISNNKIWYYGAIAIAVIGIIILFIVLTTTGMI